MKYKSYITDFHLNLHPDQIDLLDKWYDHSKNVSDFFTIAYYPYHMVEYGNFKAEEEIDKQLMEKQWSQITKFIKEKNKSDDFISFLGYEWQGAGKDGDHNIYFKNDSGKISLSERYQDLVKKYSQEDVIGIPHHLAYSLGNRGKNWETHSESFSPFAEIYSHHGSSERDITNLTMERHIHMGPRVDETSVVAGLKRGYHFGILASGDNHDVPGIVKNGRAGVWANSYTKEALWESFLNRRTFGFTDSKIIIWTEMENCPMGSIIETTKDLVELRTNIKANAKVERIELYKNGELENIHLVKPSKDSQLSKKVKFKFKIECGWGPNINYFPDHNKKLWEGILETEGKILSVEPVYNSFDNHFEIIDDNKVQFEATSRKSEGSRWVRDPGMKNEGFIFEIEANRDDTIQIDVAGKNPTYVVGDLLEKSSLIIFEEEAKELIKNETGIVSFNRSDSWYHNAYKLKLYQGFTSDQYEIDHSFQVDVVDKENSYYIKVVQADGQTGWSSPTWVKKI